MCIIHFQYMICRTLSANLPPLFELVIYYNNDRVVFVHVCQTYSMQTECKCCKIRSFVCLASLKWSCNTFPMLIMSYDSVSLFFFSRNFFEFTNDVLFLGSDSYYDGIESINESIFGFKWYSLHILRWMIEKCPFSLLICRGKFTMHSFYEHELYVYDAIWRRENGKCNA